MLPLPKLPGEATFDDLLLLPEQVAGEIVHGALVEKASPSPGHSRTQTAVGGFAYWHFDRKPGGSRPGGWWFGTEIDVEYERHELFRHDLAGWRRDRVEQFSTLSRPIRVRPDWVCEILSSNRRRDTVDKLQVLHGAAVPHYWILDPDEKTLTVYRHQPAGYQVALVAATGQTVRAEPFDAVELRVGVIFGDEDEDG